MSALCFNYRGEPFTPPGAATSWRVRRLRDGQRGQLDVVRDAAGQPLMLPIAATYEQLREAVAHVPGRYRLDMLDEQSQTIDGDAAYVTVRAPAEPMAPRNAAPSWADADGPDDDTPTATAPRGEAATVTAPYGTWPALPVPVAMTGAEYLVAEALRGQVLTISMLTSALAERSAASAAGASQMIAAAAGLLRAADGAAMPSRRPPPAPPPPPMPSSPSVPPSPPVPPSMPAFDDLPRNAMPYEDDDQDDEDDDQGDDERGAAAEHDMFAKLITIADKVQGVITPVADVARLVMGGYGHPAALRNASEVDEAPAVEPTPAPAPEVPRHLYTSHMLLVAHELGENASRFRRVILHMEPDERAALTTRLCALSLDEAVAEAAALLARIDAYRRRAEPSPDAARVNESRDDDENQGGADHDARRTPATPEASPTPAASTFAAPTGEPAHAAPEVNAAPAAPKAEAAHTAPKAEPARESQAVTATLAQGAQLVMVPTASLEPVPSARRTVNPPPGMPAADVAHAMRAIASHLSAFELIRVQSLIGATPQAERDAWIAKLLTLSHADAAALVRAELARRAG